MRCNHAPRVWDQHNLGEVEARFVPPSFSGPNRNAVQASAGGLLFNLESYDRYVVCLWTARREFPDRLG